MQQIVLSTCNCNKLRIICWGFVYTVCSTLMLQTLQIVWSTCSCSTLRIIKCWGREYALCSIKHLLYVYVLIIHVFLWTHCLTHKTCFGGLGSVWLCYLNNTIRIFTTLFHTHVFPQHLHNIHLYFYGPIKMNMHTRTTQKRVLEEASGIWHTVLKMFEYWWL